MPFSTEQFLESFAEYNRGIYPAQIFLVILALAAVVLAIIPNRFSSKIVSAILGFLWLWMGVAYHLTFFTSINPAAYFFSALFILEAALLIYGGVIRNDLSFCLRENVRGIIGTLLLVFAIILYPLLGITLGHAYPQCPTFGTPCPTTIFTFGILLWTDKVVPAYILPILLVWSFIGFTAAFLLGISEDIGLLIAGIVGSVLLLRQRGPKPSRYEPAHV